jgi:uncharacterized membrane protein
VRYILVILALSGIIVSYLALREHYREGESPCSINDKWDCGIVNKSSFATAAGVLGEKPYDLFVNRMHMAWLDRIPVAAIGIAGYLLMGVLAAMRKYRCLLVPVLGALAFSVWLSYIEDKILGVWCVYCVISAGIVVVMTLLTIGAAIAEYRREKRGAEELV